VDIGAVRVWSRDSSRAAQFSLTKTRPVTAYDSPEQAVAGIVLTTTPSRQPLVTGADLPRPRPSGDRRIVFDPVGTAVVDEAEVALVPDAAEGAGVGTRLMRH
jgi:ornithine cyclodeaminase/alanine dehydrogenase-like protein (mu-crystallin family)